MSFVYKFVLTAFAMLGFNWAGWVVIDPEANYFRIAFLVILVLTVIDLILWGIKRLIRGETPPFTVLKLSWKPYLFEGPTKYLCLYLTSLLIGGFTVPWLLGSLWQEAIIISLAFMVIACSERLPTWSHYTI